jgi:hypothetical protein
MKELRAALESCTDLLIAVPEQERQLEDHVSNLCDVMDLLKDLIDAKAKAASADAA